MTTQELSEAIDKGVGVAQLIQQYGPRLQASALGLKIVAMLISAFERGEDVDVGDLFRFSQQEMGVRET